MKRPVLLLIGILALGGTLAQAHTATDREVTRTSIGSDAYVKDLNSTTGEYSKDGATYLWSSGGLMQKASGRSGIILAGVTIDDATQIGQGTVICTGASIGSSVVIGGYGLADTNALVPSGPSFKGQKTAPSPASCSPR